MKKTIISLIVIAGLVAGIVAGCSMNDTHIAHFGGHLIGQTETKEENNKMNVTVSEGSMNPVNYKQV